MPWDQILQILPMLIKMIAEMIKSNPPPEQASQEMKDAHLAACTSIDNCHMSAVQTHDALKS